MLQRRTFLAGAAVAGAALALPARAQTGDSGDGQAPAPTPRPAPNGRTQVPAYRRLRLGDTVVTAIADGGLALPPQVLPNVSAEEFAAAMRASFLPEEAYQTSLNAFVVEDGTNVVLIDTGAPLSLGETVGKLPANLAAAGYDPADITHVLLTHMHIDHAGGLVDAGGAAVFPNATLVVRDRELQFWTDPDREGAIPEQQRGNVEVARTTRRVYGDRLTTFADDVAVVDGIEAVALYGHTPGHTGYRLTSGDGLLVWGDLVHVMPVQLAKPEIFIGFDVDPEEAVATRRRLLEQVATDRTLVAGMHMPFPGIGNLATEGAGYRFVPVPFDFSM